MWTYVVLQSSPFASFRRNSREQTKHHSAVNYSQHTTLFTLADRRHVHPESLIPTSCNREQERDDSVSPIFHLSVKTDVSCDIHPVSSRRRHEIGGTADAIAAPNRNVSHDSSPGPSMRKIGVRAHEWAPALNKVAAR